MKSDQIKKVYFLKSCKFNDSTYNESIEYLIH